jgi:catechol 2,3-dioxygenase-like lactoylglutathione lyase family enzyme
MQLTAIDHVQVAMPAGEEETARQFYGGLLGMEELVKPPVLAQRGGVWFAGPGFAVHLGVEAGFRPARKAHPCFRVDALDVLQTRLEQAGVPTTWDTDLPGVRRFYAADPFGNRLEFMEDRS